MSKPKHGKTEGRCMYCGKVTPHPIHKRCDTCHTRLWVGKLQAKRYAMALKARDQ